MATWNEQISDMAGQVSSESTATHMDNAVKDVINKISRINPEMLYLFAGEETNSAASSNVNLTDNNLILRVSRRVDLADSRYRDCKEIMPSQVGDYSDSTSLYKATKEYPVFYREGSAIKVLPAQLSAGYIVVDKVIYGTVSGGQITGLSSGTGAIANFPEGMYPMVVCHASMNTLIEMMAETAVASSLPNLGGLSLDGNPITAANFDSALDIELENPDLYFSVLRNFINTEEDIELASAQLEKIKAYLSWYQNAIEFNKVDYNWMTERLMILKDRYEKMFLPYMRQRREGEGDN